MEFKKCIEYTEYFSKWRNEWVKFKRPPTEGEVIQLKKYNYKLR